MTVRWGSTIQDLILSYLLFILVDKNPSNIITNLTVIQIGLLGSILGGYTYTVATGRSAKYMGIVSHIGAHADSINKPSVKRLIFCIFCEFNVHVKGIDQQRASAGDTRKLSYRKAHRAMRPVYGRPENFQESLTTPTAILFPNF